jgi:hypothetical protein
VGDRFRGRFATSADFPRTIVARTEGYTYDAKVWDLCLVQGPLSVAGCQTLNVSDSQLVHRCVYRRVSSSGARVIQVVQALLHQTHGQRERRQRVHAFALVRIGRSGRGVCVRLLQLQQLSWFTGLEKGSRGKKGS